MLCYELYLCQIIQISEVRVLRAAMPGDWGCYGSLWSRLWLTGRTAIDSLIYWFIDYWSTYVFMETRMPLPVYVFCTYASIHGDTYVSTHVSLSIYLSIYWHVCLYPYDTYALAYTSYKRWAHWLALAVCCVMVYLLPNYTQIRGCSGRTPVSPSAVGEGACAEPLVL